MNLTEEKGKYYIKSMMWEKSNKFLLFIMKHTISFEIKNAIPDSLHANEYLVYVEEYFQDISPVKDSL